VTSIIVPLALAELREATAFYADRAGVDLGLAFVAEFERVVKIIHKITRFGGSPTVSCTTWRKMASFESLRLRINAVAQTIGPSVHDALTP